MTLAEINKVIEAAPDVQWPLIVALARFSGLRTPSEPLALKWSDMDWERQRIRVAQNRTLWQTELVQTFPAHVVCSSMGNSEAVAGEHYLHTTDNDFQKAAQIPTQSGTEMVESDGKPGIRPMGENEKGPEFPSLSISFRILRKKPVTRPGLETAS